MSIQDNKSYYLREIIGRREANKIAKKATEKAIKQLKMDRSRIKLINVETDITVSIAYH